MKNFLSQTWVVAVLVLVAIAAIVAVGYKVSNGDDYTPAKK